MGASLDLDFIVDHSIAGSDRTQQYDSISETAFDLTGHY